MVATVECVEDLTSPRTLTNARALLRPGAIASAAIPRGARVIAVESGVLAVVVTADGSVQAFWLEPERLPTR